MSVLIVSTFLSKTNTSRGYSEELADRLEARGRVVVRTSTKVGRVGRLLDMLGTAWRYRARYRCAIIDVFSGPSFIWAEAITFELRRLGKPYVLVLRGGALPAFAARWPRRVRTLFAGAHAVIAPSGYLANALRSYGAEITIVPNAIEVAAYEYRERQKASARLVWVRAHHAIYNPVLAIDVVDRVAKQFPEAHLVMVGADKDGSRRAVEDRVRELGLRERVDIVGVVAKREIPKYLAAADVFLNTTDIDNTPVSVLEAMASGLCIASTDVGGLPYLLQHEVTAMLVPPRDPAAMTSAVATIAGDPQVATRLSRSARTYAEGCDWSRVLDRWDALIGEIS